MPANTNWLPRAMNSNLSLVFMLISLIVGGFLYVFRNLTLVNLVSFYSLTLAQPTAQPEVNPLANNSLTITEYAQLFNLSPHSVRKKVNSGELPAEKTGGRWIIKVDLDESPLNQEVNPEVNQTNQELNLSLIKNLEQQIADQKDQLATKDQQIEKLQSALDQSQQLHAMSEKRHESELDQIKGRSFLQRLKAVLVANP